MVKVKEFCCGCSLRSGTLILAWSLIVYYCLLLQFVIPEYLSKIHRWKQYDVTWQEFTFSTSTLIFNIVRSTAGIAVSVIAIWALQKNKAKFLSGLYWYLCYIATATVVGEILILFVPDWEAPLGIGNPFMTIFLDRDEESIVMIFMTYLLQIAVVLYFALVVKSCRDYALNENQNVRFVGPDATTVGYISV